MDDERPLFILAGNGPYTNRGCEAIVRGTTKIIRIFFKDPSFLCLSHSLSERDYIKQAQEEFDPKVVHKPIYNLTKLLSREGLARSYLHIFNQNMKKYRTYREMLPYLDDAQAVLSIGGDNYSLDYGVPRLYTDLNDIVLEKRKPLILWGASVGPFDTMPDYERYMSHHLQEVPGIFARESVTIDYLKSIGVTENVYPVADPAFLMDPVKPAGIEDVLPLDEEAIGLNLSPLMAKYVTGGDLGAWTGMAASIIDSVAQMSGMPVYLIPHVTSPDSNDHEFMQRALSLIKDRNGNITLVSPEYNAAETKWIISQMAFFAGARTHSTIAAISSCVPTLSFAYSIKALGINKDIFGHESYCLSTCELNSDAVMKKVESMLSSEEHIRSTLCKKMPLLERRALDAGKHLHYLLNR